MSENRFAAVTDIEELIAQVVGAGSSPRLWMSERTAIEGDPLSYAEPLPATCDTLGRPCIFDSRAASEIVTDAIQRLSQLLGEDKPPTFPIGSGDLAPYCVDGTIVEAPTGRVYLHDRYWKQIYGEPNHLAVYIDLPVRIVRAGDGR